MQAQQNLKPGESQKIRETLLSEISLSYKKYSIINRLNFFHLGFIPKKVAHPIQGMAFQEKDKK